MKIVLIGFMGSGKTKVGQILAKKLGWPHHDTDAMIVKQVGMSIADIIRTKGEPAFRDIESKAVSLISLMDRVVISTGGGVPTVDKNMQELSRDAHVVWLKVSPPEVLKRSGNLKSRPLIDPKRPMESIIERLSKREPFYQKANHVIETDGRTPHDVADEIIRMIPEVAS